MTTWAPILITPDGDILLYKANGEYFSLLKHSSISGTQRHRYPRAEAQALWTALGQWLGMSVGIDSASASGDRTVFAEKPPPGGYQPRTIYTEECPPERCLARPVSDFDGVPLPAIQTAPYVFHNAQSAPVPDSVERAAGILELQGDDPATLVRRLRATVQLLATAPEAELELLAQECAAMDERIYAATREQGQRMPLAAPPVDSESRGSPLASPQGSTGFLEGKNEVSAESVLEHCLTVERRLGAYGFQEEREVAEVLIAWRIPASGRYADHATELARQSEGRYPVEGEEVTR